MQVWWHGDFHRKTFSATHAVIIDIGGWPKVGVTPNHGAAQEVFMLFNKLKELCPQHVVFIQ